MNLLGYGDSCTAKKLQYNNLLAYLQFVFVFVVTVFNHCALLMSAVC